MSTDSIHHPRRFGRRLRLLGGSILMICSPVAVLAQTAATPPAPASDSAMVNLVRLLVQQKVLSKAKGDALMAQAEAEAANARQAALAAAAPAPQQPSMPAVAEGAIRVPYVPESVRAQIRDELKQDVLAQAKAEGWAAPAEAAPDWTRRVSISGDIRVRSQSAFFARGNDTLIPDFARLNAIGPIPLFLGFIPTLNSTQDRPDRLLLRARLGVNAQVSPNIDVGFQLATGETNSPVSTNASLGGGFGKRDLWLQEGYLRAHSTDNMVVAEAGRFTNPFFHTDLHFDEDLAFDGVMLELNGGGLLGDGLTATVRGGAFPLNFGDPNFPQNDVNKRKAPERWLFAGQVELGAKFSDDLSARVGVGYFSYQNMRANLSEPCFIYRVQPDFRRTVICSTDNEAANFLQKGNTVFPIRDINLDQPPLQDGEPPRVQPELVGLLFNYRILDVNAEAKFRLTDDIDVTVAGNYLQNLAFDRGQVCRLGPGLSAQYPPSNNIEPSSTSPNPCDPTNPGKFIGGNKGYLGSVAVGYRELDHWGQWQVKAGYRYLESDAVLDAFTDSDFHLGGTNAKGYFVSARTGITHGTNIGVRWLSANEINAEPFSIDVLQIDLNAHF